MPNTNDHLTICINNCASPNKLRNDKARGGSFGDGASGLSFFGGFSVMLGNERVARRRPDAVARHASSARQRLIFACVMLLRRESLAPPAAGSENRSQKRRKVPRAVHAAPRVWDVGYFSS